MEAPDLDGRWTENYDGIFNDAAKALNIINILVAGARNALRHKISFRA